MIHMPAKEIGLLNLFMANMLSEATNKSAPIGANNPSEVSFRQRQLFQAMKVNVKPYTVTGIFSPKDMPGYRIAKNDIK